MVNSKPKGNSYENKIATTIRRKFVPSEFGGKIAHNLVHRTPMSGGHVEKGDIIVKPPILKWFPWFIECRNRESWSWKNVMEKGQDSLIGKWYREDAVQKCHAYDHNAYNTEYYRFPLLLFTQNFGKNYFCAEEEDILRVIPSLDTQGDILQAFYPCVWIASRVIGRFSIFLNLHPAPPDQIAKDVNKYLGEHHG